MPSLPTPPRASLKVEIVILGVLCWEQKKRDSYHTLYWQHSRYCLSFKLLWTCDWPMRMSQIVFCQLFFSLALFHLIHYQLLLALYIQKKDISFPLPLRLRQIHTTSPSEKLRSLGVNSAPVVGTALAATREVFVKNGDRQNQLGRKESRYKWGRRTRNIIVLSKYDLFCTATGKPVSTNGALVKLPLFISCYSKGICWYELMFFLLEQYSTLRIQQYKNWHTKLHQTNKLWGNTARIG